MAYGVLDAGDHLELCFMRGSGGVDFARGPTRVRRLASLTGAPRPIGLRTTHCGQSASNAIACTQRLAAVNPRKLAPVARALHPRFGLDTHDFMRALICDGPALLAWVGVFQRETIAPWQHASLKALIAPLRRRLVVERRLERVSA